MAVVRRPPARLPASAPAAAERFGLDREFDRTRVVERVAYSFGSGRSTRRMPAEPAPEQLAAARGTTPTGLKRLLAGDLDMIVLMALRKEPERRYASAALFADDLRRHLDGRPVSARADSTIYRVGRFVRRHVAAVAAAVAVVLALVAAVAGTTTGLVLARRERDRALLSSRQARQAVDQFFTRVSEERLLNQPGLHLLRKELLQDAERFYEGVLAEHGRDPASRAELAAARSRLARITAVIGSPVEAALGFQQAIALWDDLLRSHPGKPEYQEALARTLNDQAAVLMRQKGRRDDCARSLSPCASDPRAAGRRPRRPGRDAVRAGPRPRKTSSRSSSSKVSRARRSRRWNECSRSKVSWPRSIPMRSTHGSRWPRPITRWARSCSGSRTVWPRHFCPVNKASIFLNRSTASTPSWRIRRTRWRWTWATREYCSKWLASSDSALTSIRRAVEVLERLDRQYPGVLDYQRGLASTFNLMSDLHRRRLEPADSLAMAEKGRSLLERLVAEHPEDVEARTELAKSYNNIARVHQQSGETGEALRAYQRTVDLYEGLPELESGQRL